MSTHECSACKKKVYGSHYCEIEDRLVDEGDPLLSGIVAAATDSATLGWLIGGSLTGAVLGDLLDGDLFD